MSLINDALKRASQTAKDRPSQASISAPMEPVQEPARPKFNFALVGGSLVLAILALAGWFFFQWYHQRHQHSVRPPAVASAPATQRPMGAPGVPQSSPPPSQLRSAVPAVVSAQRPVNPAATTPVAHPPVVATSSQSLAVVVPPPARAPASVTPSPAAVVQPAPTPLAKPAVPFPNLQVKGIFYNRRRPYALINDETVGEGERVLGVRIVKIQPDRVTLELNGRIKQLVLGE